jgi:hypothetical protein
MSGLCGHPGHVLRHGGMFGWPASRTAGAEKHEADKLLSHLSAPERRPRGMRLVEASDLAPRGAGTAAAAQRTV